MPETTVYPPAGLTLVPAVSGEGTSPDAPAVLILPGGGYAGLADHEAEPVAHWLASLGMHAFVLRYSVSPNRHPQPLLDAKAAMAWIRTGGHGLRVSPGRVAVLGFSAGGHLAATLSTGVPTEDAALDVPANIPDLSILCYPVISFTADVHQGSINNLVGPAEESDNGYANPVREELLHQLSAELNVSASTPPAFLWHTADDVAVPVENSLAYTGALRRAGVAVELHVFPHGRHGLGLAQDTPGVSQWTSLCAAWLRSLGWA